MAIASVVLYHLSGFVPLSGINSAVAHGYRGVNLFYVISGFVLGMPFAMHHLTGAPRVSLRAYFIRRLTRLEPPYILNLLICFALVVIAQGANPSALLPHLGASVLYLHNQIFGEQSPINPVAWTLEIEVQFYCLMPVLAAVFSLPSKNVRRIVFSASILLAGAVQVLLWDAPPRAKLSILYAIQFFVAGLLLADVFMQDWHERPQSDWRWDLVSCACWPILFLMPDREGWIVFPFLILLAYVSAFRGVLFRKIFRNALITAVGGMCYTIYLFHYQLLPLLAGRGALLYFVVLAAVSCAYFLAIERPCMKKDWPRRLAGLYTRSMQSP